MNADLLSPIGKKKNWHVNEMPPSDMPEQPSVTSWVCLLALHAILLTEPLFLPHNNVVTQPSARMHIQTKSSTIQAQLPLAKLRKRGGVNVIISCWA